MMLFALTLMAPALVAEGELTLLPSGATQKRGYYMPKKVTLSTTAPGELKTTPTGFTTPMFGFVEIGGKKFIAAAERPATGDWVLKVDTNNNGDLNDDESAAWTKKVDKTDYGKELTMYMGTAKVDFGRGPVSIGVYMFDPNDPRRQALKDDLLYYPDYALTGKVKIDSKEYDVIVSDDGGTGFALPAEGVPPSRLLIDRNGDGKYDGRWEHFSLGKALTLGGKTYSTEVVDANLVFTPSSEKVAEVPQPPDFPVGSKVVNFKGKTLDGKSVSFPGTFKGKLVILDVWATWCGPCIGEIPHMKEAYSKFKDQGLEILSVSIDDPNMADKVKAFVKEKGTNWVHLYQGKGWDSEIVKQYGISGIPFMLLVDGDTGEVVATEDKLRGPQLSSTVQAALANKKKSTK